MSESLEETSISENPKGTEEKFKCPFPDCNKCFISKSVLERHIRVHTGEKPYVCHVCGKGFSQHGNMTKHLKTHENSHLRWDRNTNSKPFKCHFPGCSKSFTAKTTLQSHLLSYHGKRKLENSELYDLDQKSENLSDSFEHSTLNDSCKSPILNSSSAKPTSICLHEGCNLTFGNEKELREHIYSFTPGLNAEHNFLIETVINFADLLESWGEKSQEDKESILSYAKTVKETVSSMKIVSPEPNNSKSTCNHSHNPSHNFEHSDITNESNTNNSYEKESYNQNIEIPSNIHGIDEMSTYFEDTTKPSLQNTSTNNTGIYSSALQNHNYINEGWNPQGVESQTSSFPHPNAYNPTVNLTPQYQSNILSYPQQYPDLLNYAPNRTLFSWEEAIMRSRSMMSEGIAHPLFIIHPCQASPYNASYVDHPNGPNLLNNNNGNPIYPNNYYKNNPVSENKKPKIEYSNM